MSQDNQFQYLDNAIEEKGDDQAVLSMGTDRGFKLIPADQW